MLSIVDGIMQLLDFGGHHYLPPPYTYTQPRAARATTQAIRKARQRLRPGAIVYGDEETYRNVKALIKERASENDSLHEAFKDSPEEGLLRDV